MTDRCLAVIPARAGSAGLPNKNLRTVGGKSLVVLAVESAKSAGCFQRIVVSSDSSDILRAGESAGASGVQRPESLSGSGVPVSRALEHAVGFLKNRGEEYDWLCLLNPTSPLRSSEDILAVKDEMKRIRAKSGMTLVENHQLEVVHLQEVPRVAYHRKLDLPTNRQARRPRLMQAGSVYWVSVPHLMEAHEFIAPRFAGVVVPKERAIDIDDYFDLAAAEAWFQELQRQRGVAA